MERLDANPETLIWGSAVPDPERQDLLALKARWVLDNLPAEAGPRILDYGFGQGKISQLISDHRPDAELVGVDIEPPRTSRGFEFRMIEPGGDLPFAENRFDVAVSCDVLEHVESIDAVLLGISRVLKPGGLFIGNVPLEGGFRPHSLFRLFDSSIYRDTKDHHHNYTRSEMLARLSGCFEVEDLRYSYHLFGGFMDAAFFASFKLPVFGSKLQDYFWGQDNSFYREQEEDGRQSWIGTLAELAHKVAFFESRALNRVSLGACALHFRLKNRMT